LRSVQMRFSVVILVVDKNCILTFEGEGEPPISIDTDCPMTSKLTAQCVELPSGKCHLFRFCGCIQSGELLIELGGMAGPNSSLGASRKELLDSLMPKAANHSGKIVLRNVTLHNGWLPVH